MRLPSSHLQVQGPPSCTFRGWCLVLLLFRARVVSSLWGFPCCVAPCGPAQGGVASLLLVRFSSVRVAALSALRSVRLIGVDDFGGIWGSGSRWLCG